MSKLVKPGVKSTEFWITILITILGAGLALMPEGHWSHGVAGAVMAALAGLGYNVSRGLAKRSPKDDGFTRAPLLFLGSVLLALMIALGGCGVNWGKMGDSLTEARKAYTSIQDDRCLKMAKACPGGKATDDCAPWVQCAKERHEVYRVAKVGQCLVRSGQMLDTSGQAGKAKEVWAKLGAVALDLYSKATKYKLLEVK